MAGNPFDEGLDFARQSWKWGKVGHQIGRTWRAKRERQKAEAEFGPEVADAVEAAVRAGRDPSPIYERARQARRDREERDKLLREPPPLHGSARWAKPGELGKVLKGRDAFDTPSSILLGSYTDEGFTERTEFVHWDDDGHLLTIAPTRSGKAQTVIIPNLLRYRGSAVVLDPKGELYEAASAWRAANVGPVYRWAPFDDGARGFPRHRFNPLAGVRSEHDARLLAEQFFPKDPHASDFFSDDAIAFLTALMLFVRDEAPADARHLAMVHKLATLPLAEFRGLVERRMAKSALHTVRAAADNILNKSGDRGLPNFRDTLHSKFARWGSPELLDSFKGHEFDFGALKDGPATVYLDVPFELMKPYAPVLRVILKAALDAMLHNRTLPRIPVLFVLDEFLQLGPFPEFRDAIRTHAGAGVRLWFFLQDYAGLQEHYRDGWMPFFNCAVRQFFGINDPFTAELVGKFLGVGTQAFLATNMGSNLSAQGGGGWFGGNTGGASTSMSTGESIQFIGRPLMTPDEVMAELSSWHDGGWRWGIVDLAAAKRPFRVRLSVVANSPTCKARLGAFQPKEISSDAS